MQPKKQKPKVLEQGCQNIPIKLKVPATSGHSCHVDAHSFLLFLSFFRGWGRRAETLDLTQNIPPIHAFTRVAWQKLLDSKPQ